MQNVHDIMDRNSRHAALSSKRLAASATNQEPAAKGAAHGGLHAQSVSPVASNPSEPLHDAAVGTPKTSGRVLSGTGQAGHTHVSRDVRTEGAEGRPGSSSGPIPSVCMVTLRRVCPDDVERERALAFLRACDNRGLLKKNGVVGFDAFRVVHYVLAKDQDESRSTECESSTCSDADLEMDSVLHEDGAFMLLMDEQTSFPNVRSVHGYIQRHRLCLRDDVATAAEECVIEARKVRRMASGKSAGGGRDKRMEAQHSDDEHHDPVAVATAKRVSYIEDWYPSLHALHRNNHTGVKKLWYTVNACIFGIPRDVVALFIEQCTHCQKSKTAHVRKSSMPLKQIKETEFNNRAQADLIFMRDMPFKEHDGDEPFLYILNYQCHATKLVALRALKRKTADDVADALSVIFGFYGPPHILQTDNGTEFIGPRVLQLCNDHSVVRIHGAPRHPQSQGSVERSNAVVVQRLRALLSEHGGSNWPALLPFVQLSMNRSFHETTGTTPYELAFRATLVHDKRALNGAGAGAQVKQQWSESEPLLFKQQQINIGADKSLEDGVAVSPRTLPTGGRREAAQESAHPSPARAVRRNSDGYSSAHNSCLVDSLLQIWYCSLSLEDTTDYIAPESAWWSLIMKHIQARQLRYFSLQDLDDARDVIHVALCHATGEVYGSMLEVHTALHECTQHAPRFVTKRRRQCLRCKAEETRHITHSCILALDLNHEGKTTAADAFFRSAAGLAAGTWKCESCDGNSEGAARMVCLHFEVTKWPRVAYACLQQHWTPRQRYPPPPARTALLSNSDFMKNFNCVSTGNATYEMVAVLFGNDAHFIATCNIGNDILLYDDLQTPSMRRLPVDCVSGSIGWVIRNLRGYMPTYAIYVQVANREPASSPVFISEALNAALCNAVEEARQEPEVVVLDGPTERKNITPTVAQASQAAKPAHPATGDAAGEIIQDDEFGAHGRGVPAPHTPACESISAKGGFVQEGNRAEEDVMPSSRQDDIKPSRKRSRSPIEKLADARREKVLLHRAKQHIRRKVKEFEAGSVVWVAVPRHMRTHATQRHMHGVIVERLTERTSGLPGHTYSVLVPHGIIEEPVTAAELHEDLSESPETEDMRTLYNQYKGGSRRTATVSHAVAVRSARVEQSTSTQRAGAALVVTSEPVAIVSCNCRKGCERKHCACRKAGQACGSVCHPRHDCCNRTPRTDDKRQFM